MNTGLKDKNGVDIYVGDTVEYVDTNTTPHRLRQEEVKFQHVDGTDYGTVLYPFCEAVKGQYLEKGRENVILFCTPSLDTEVIKKKS